MPLPPYYLEAIKTDEVACMVTVLVNGWGILQVLFVSFTKGPGGFPYVFIITREVTTLEPTDGPVFQFSLRPDEVHISGWKLVYKCNQSSVTEKNYFITTRDNRMRNLHQLQSTFVHEAQTSVFPLVGILWPLPHFFCRTFTVWVDHTVGMHKSRSIFSAPHWCWTFILPYFMISIRLARWHTALETLRAATRDRIPFASWSPNMDIDVLLLRKESDLSVCPNTAKLIFLSPGLPTEKKKKSWERRLKVARHEIVVGVEVAYKYIQGEVQYITLSTWSPYKKRMYMTVKAAWNFV